MRDCGGGMTNPGLVAGFGCTVCGFFRPMTGFNLDYMKREWAAADEEHQCVRPMKGLAAELPAIDSTRRLVADGTRGMERGR